MSQGVDAKARQIDIHASTVMAGEAGILIRGASGSGKSGMALALIGLVTAQMRPARLVADDRTCLEVRHGRLIASCKPAVAGLIERRGLGLVPMPHEPRVIVRLVVDCLGREPERMPEAEDLVTELLGLTLPRIAIHGRSEDAGLVQAALELFTR